MRWTLLPLAGTLAFYPLAALSQELPLTLDQDQAVDLGELLNLNDLLNLEIEIGSTQSKNVFQTQSTVSVIDRSMIETYNFRDVGEALRALAGVDVMRTYLKQSIPTIRGILQEHYATKVLVLIDGVPSWNAVTGEGNIERVSINEIERIEVLKGPASVLYGTNALTGAINIVTRRSSYNGGSMELRAGDRGHFGASGAYTFVDPKQKLEVFIGASGFSDSGYDQSFTDEVGITGSYNQYETRANFTSRVKYDVHQLRFNGFFINESSLGVVPQYSRGAGENHSIEGYSIRYDVGGTPVRGVHMSVGGYFDYGKRDIPRGSTSTAAFGIQRSDITGVRLGAVTSFRWQALEWLTLELGGYFDYRRSESYDTYNELTNRIVSASNMQGREVTELSVYGQAEVALNHFSLAAGIRLTNNELFDTNISARGTAVYAFTDTISLKLVAGQSFRAPTVFELFFETPTQTVSGNENLSPETSNSIELALIAAFGDLYLSVLGYGASYENKIFRRTVPLSQNRAITSNRYFNGERAIQALGSELEVKYRNPRLFDAFFNYYFVAGNDEDEVDDDGNYNFKFIPKHSFALGFAKSLGPFSGSTVFNYIHNRDGFHETIEGDFTLDLSASYEWRSTKHSIVAKNITNESVDNPEFVRRQLNSVPGMFGRLVYYTFAWEF